MKKTLAVLLFFTVALLVYVLMPGSTLAQDASRQQRKLQITDADKSAAAEATELYQHALAARTEAGAAAKRSDRASVLARVAERARSSDDSSSEGASSEGEGADKLRFPGTLSNFFGGPTLSFTQSHPIFLVSPDLTTCAANTCWGDPDTFLEDFGHSGLSHVTDQYVGEHADNRYTLGDQFLLPFAPTPKTAPLLDVEIEAIVHAAALFSGQSGPDHIFHVFLPPGQDECAPNLGIACYSPDVPANFAFCAYHNSVNFKDVGTVLYTVEPFQNVLGCNVRPGTVNGQLIDSTNSTLSHELIESITDPLGDAFRNFVDGGLFGEEIGDECELVTIIQVAPNQFALFGDPTEFRVGRHRFATQPEYSNEDHACAIAP